MPFIGKRFIAARHKRAVCFLLSISIAALTCIASYVDAAEVAVTPPNSVGEMPLGIAPNIIAAPIPAVPQPTPASTVTPPPAVPNAPLSKSVTPPSLSNPRVEEVIRAKVLAKGSSSEPSWKDLPTTQQQALAPLKPEWEKLDNRHKTKWLEIGRKFASMSPNERARIQERMQAWVALTPDQRRVARESYVRTKKLNNDQKSAQWEQYKNLPEEQKKKLAAEASKNKVATPPSATSKAKIVQPIKSTPVPILQRSVTPATQRSVTLPPPATLPAPAIPVAVTPTDRLQRN